MGLSDTENIFLGVNRSPTFPSAGKPTGAQCAPLPSAPGMDVGANIVRTPSRLPGDRHAGARCAPLQIKKTLVG